MAGYGTLHEVKHLWNINDLLDSHEVLDMKEAAERAMLERTKGRK